MTFAAATELPEPAETKGRLVVPCKYPESSALFACTEHSESKCLISLSPDDSSQPGHINDRSRDERTLELIRMFRSMHVYIISDYKDEHTIASSSKALMRTASRLPVSWNIRFPPSFYWLMLIRATFCSG
jgi:hypothetical protein